ncbi:RtcB family protein [Pedobacter sp. HMF7647]|uniref:3'-phosphate/5'-hydroxy nucleic acid ligase n=1 Tax=Hufsiella arboris TaxID=2695275 RepID=A0A7K1YCY4_9SPHI|nr:RtcB family protein [Hufsiella arboris]MXV52452.1 RtcB family protein [Hufsiella arboris]
MDNSIKTKDLTKISYTNNTARSLVASVFNKHFKYHSKDEKLEILVQIKDRPQDFLANEGTAKIAQVFAGGEDRIKPSYFSLLDKPAAFKVYGAMHVDDHAIKQMELAMSLPISIQGALMPDAHGGYGLPIGAALATDNAVIPYGVGMDIGCRMRLSILDASDSYLQRYDFQLKQALRNFTHFGMEGGLGFRQEHEVLEHPLFRSTPLLRRLHGKAARQLGTSGNGNHFVEFGEIMLYEGNSLGLPANKYLALLSHSGSRGLGAAIAKEYTAIAMERCKLPNNTRQLAWLSLDSEAGAEYWQAMNLAGDYAKACHDRIHINVLKDLGLKILAKVENHHNFAWKDRLPDGKEVIIHRKGATPAHAGELGIIPGSMTAPAYLVRGLGIETSLYSAAHGAGRALSRQKAKDSMTGSGMKQLLSKAGVTLIGGNIDENPRAYKDIEKVMHAQKALVSTEGVFYPKIVRMSKD